MNRKSRYFTIRAAIHSPTENDAANAKMMKTGRKRILIGGTNLYHPIRTINSNPQIKKSTRLTITLLVGTMSRGKYTLEIRLVLLTRLCPLSANAVAKNCHGNIAQKTNNGYGTPPEGIFANLEKTIVRTPTVSTGRITDQDTPT